MEEEGKKTEIKDLGDLCTGVDHVALVVSDIGRSLHFYAGVLGLKQIARPDFHR